MTPVRAVWAGYCVCGRHSHFEHSHTHTAFTHKLHWCALRERERNGRGVHSSFQKPECEGNNCEFAADTVLRVDV